MTPGDAPHLRLLSDPAATAALGRELAAELLAWQRCGQSTAPLLLLFGDLGAGKTCLVQGLAEGLGIGEPITSPTFALAQHYEGQLADGTPTALVHLDLYRLEDPASADELLLQEEEEAQALGAILAVEWPGRLSAMPEDAWQLELELTCPTDPERGRMVRIRPPQGAPDAPARPQ
ncbi:MAG: tRNA (adenosine(37)-N6)-threonylcarbamoyltransferase complex ATPase subunit type 1 TsaE [Cyanobacteria bacterium]|nr:tRNA (adenosine(37)-N6)-threonylcarbamoyltransferase complex ATPase subunit type 1 TsaE [Cyanobacteriota bacterium]